MEQGIVYIDILIQSLEKKIDVLDRIIAKNEEQKEILAMETMDEEAFLQNLSDKGDLIDELNLLDEGFEEVFNREKDELNGKREQYKDEITRMQELISAITDKSMTIRAGEERNRVAAQKQFEAMRGAVSHVKRSRNAATKYYSSMSNVNYVDAQFMDKRK